METSINASQLPGLLDTLPATIKALSLDCFDTVFWRKVAQPVDVFFELQQTPLWQAAGVTASLRAKAEEAARRRRQLSHGTREVSIEDIYRELLRTDQADEIQQWVSAEISAEADHGFVYQPVVELIRSARAKGLRVFIVSDIYYSSAQLARLLESALGEDFGLIERIHTSSEHGRSKSTGLWEPVLRRERLEPRQVFHLGDNPKADYDGPTRHGILARQLVNLPSFLLPMTEAREQAAMQLMPEVRGCLGLPSAYHAQWAAHGHAIEASPQRLGYFVLGPIFHSFSTFIRSELQRLAQDGRPVKFAFLLRDGYLPARAFASFEGINSCPQIQVSRFTANAASLRTRDDVIGLLSSSLSASNLDTIASQLMLPSDVAKSIVERARRDRNPVETFSRLVLRDDVLKKIHRASDRVRESLFEHIRVRTGLSRGDTLALIDLGYSGTVQTRLSSVFRDHLDVELRGIYLIASRAAANQGDRCGLIGPDWADERLIQALTAYIGSFEMMCTKAEPSVIDYTADGEPVFGALGKKGQQLDCVRQMQDACLRFIDDVRRTPAKCLPRMRHDELARQTVADLGRLIYLPEPEEIACQAGFEFDFNLGTDLMLSIVDLDRGVREFRREGFAMMNRDIDAMRISYPMEMRYMDMSLATTLMAAQRFGFAIKPSQASYRRESIPLMLADGTRHSLTDVEAQAGHDGFYVLNLPLSAGFGSGVLWGRRYEWIQIDSIEKVSLSDPTDRIALIPGQDVMLDGIDPTTQDLLHCGDQGLLFIPPCPAAVDRQYRVQIVFRPISERAVPAPVQAVDAPSLTEA